MTFGSLASTDKAVLITLCTAVVLMGVYPAPLNDLAEESARNIMQWMK
jgi:NADH:ubiquinone oxidoreductase subunit 4 (subunit M)